jgi:chromosome segregation protein
MHLRSVTLKGFKSFPDRTRLVFDPGVSVIVGPNGSGKSNVTDAVLWAMGEQSPLAVRGQSMQDVIFGGGRGVQARSAAEVEIVLDNGDGAVDLPMGEISILRRLGRDGDGEYRLNGARCRLADVLEVLSDTGLGKEMHSVVSQGRVEAIVTSKPRDRRLLIEEAAGLGKHRKRRRRAQLKLERTQDNLDRALDVEREARSRLRPLKRQAEAAELHERLERQMVEARWELARDAVRARAAELATAGAAAADARKAREAIQAELGAVAARRQKAEEALAARTEQRETLAQRVFRARSAAERVELRQERTREGAQNLADRIERRDAQLAALRAQAAEDQPDESGRERLEALEAELQRLDLERAAELECELAALEEQRATAAARVAELDAEAESRRTALAEAERGCDEARGRRREAEQAAEKARRDAARVGAELARANQFLRSHSGSRVGGPATRALADDVHVEAGYELALAAALGGRLSAAVVEDLEAAGRLLDRSGRDGGQALVVDAAGDSAEASRTPSAAAGGPAAGDAAGEGSPDAAPPGSAPLPGAVRLASLVRGDAPGARLARRLLADTWVVDDLGALPPGFAGTAVTRGGRAWAAVTRELRQEAAGGAERVLAVRNERDALVAASEEMVQAERAALAGVEGVREDVAKADAARDEAERGAREATRAATAAREEERQARTLIERRRREPEHGAAAVRRAQIGGELAAERRNAERAARERAERAARIERLEISLVRDRALVPATERLASVLAQVLGAVRNRLEALEAELTADRQAGEGVAAQLRACASEEAQLQRRLSDAGEAVTAAEVRAQSARDHEADARQELQELAARLELAAEPAEEPLDAATAEDLRRRIERLQRRREQLGPVNPLAKQEYEEALAHVEELERQRTDLETALRELRTLIRDTDRQIRETFEATFTAAAKNFEELAAHCFPGGRGRLRLVRDNAGPRAVIGGQGSDDEATLEAAEEAADAAAEAEAAGEDGPDDDVGVEIEITPAGKAMKRLTLLSGGEKSMTAIAFLFAVFLAKPCPFYILDEVEAALDDLNTSRFLELLREYRHHAQFIVVTHQKRTMEAADTLYGVSMGDDGVSKVVSRKLPREVVEATEAERAAAAGAA